MRLSRALCTTIGDSLSGSHSVLDALFISAGAPSDPPDLAHHSKWKEWLFRVGQDPDTDSLLVLGNIIEELMDVSPEDQERKDIWQSTRQRIVNALETDGLQYFQGGRIIPNGQTPVDVEFGRSDQKPTTVDELLSTVVHGLPRAMLPLVQRRKGFPTMSFQSEYDIQDLLHALLRPWISDIRPEEFVPSYAGSNTRMDFLLPKHSIVIETKLVRDQRHGKKIGDELIIDIAHYQAHPSCEKLWCVIYDPGNFIPNVAGLVSDLEDTNTNSRGSVAVKTVVI